MPRSKHADFAPPVRRSDPIALLESQAVSRAQDLVPIRYGRMLVSPFTFYRGAALVMANDLASTPTTGLRVQLCGDAHLVELRHLRHAGAPPGVRHQRLRRDAPGPFEWDIKRLAASLEVAGRDRGFTALERDGGRARGGGRLPHGDGRVRPPDEPRGVLREPRHRPDARGVPPEGHQGDDGPHRGHDRQGPHPRQHARVREDDRVGRRRAAHQERSAAGRSAPRRS